MTGQVIPFRSYRKCEATAPRRSRGPSVRSTRNLKRQVARIARLLDELDQLTRTSSKFPPDILGQAQAGMERAGKLLRPCSVSERNAGDENDIEDDPQPDIDGAMLERMYGKLNPGA